MHNAPQLHPDRLREGLTSVGSLRWDTVDTIAVLGLAFEFVCVSTRDGSFATRPYHRTLHYRTCEQVGRHKKLADLTL